MRVAVTGTPGTGKTTATALLADREHTSAESDCRNSLSSFEVVHLNEVITEHEFTTGHDEHRDSAIVDIEAVSGWLDERDDVIFESHLAHYFAADRVVVCRCHPEELERRLDERGENADSIAENVESEALDVILAEAVERHGPDRIYEIETTDRDPDAVASEIEAVVSGSREPSAGTVSYIEYL